MENILSDDPSSLAISLRGLKKTYSSRKTKEIKEALKGIDLDIPKGSIYGLLGPNGAGKSTLINILAGLVIKSGGTATVHGHDIEKDMRAARLSLGVVPQELVLDTFFTVREALEIHAGYYGVPKAHRRTDEIIDALGLSDKANIPARKLSGGMRRRLLIAKALVHNPKVLILDEPTAGVDVELRTQLWNYVRKLNSEGTTILLTTHYLEEAEELCEYIAIINHGTLVACDRKDKLMQGFDSKQMILRLVDSPTTLPATLQAQGWELRKDGRIALRYQPSQTNFEKIIGQVKEAGLHVVDISTRETELEEIFLHLTTDAPAAA